MSKYLEKLYVYGNNKLFNEKDEYVIPLYQRAFAWTQKELIQLIEDISDNKGNEYYIGSLIVNVNDGKFEVIDGQQRLTALFLLLNALDINPPLSSLKFECREKSNYTLEKLNDTDYDNKRSEDSIFNGKKIIDDYINDPSFKKDEFIKKLKNVIIYRIEVPQNTDLNRYFEIMNTRGEQLEQADIIKARLMSALPLEKQYAFSDIWNAVSDMSGYVQMHFVKREREILFGKNWNELTSQPIEKLKFHKNDDKKATKIRDIVYSDSDVELQETQEYDDSRIRFDSIIEFPFFLLHILKIYIKKYDVKSENKPIINELLDDRKLISSFENVLTNGLENGASINREKFAIQFIELLLKGRFLFDKYVIKRENTINDDNAFWSLKYIKTIGKAEIKKAYFEDSYFKLYDKHNSLHKYNVMIQSALRVSYTSPKVMHWITDVLERLIINNDHENLHTFCENFAKNACQEYIDDPDRIANAGVNTPHIVFNYLDYLIWKKEKTADFVFEFRNSVEHWYPQRPSESTFPIWSENINRFGNLCLIQREINSKFSNMAPEAKKSTFKDMIAKGSLKLKKMANDTTSSEDWREQTCALHEKQMLDLLNQ